MSQTTTNCRHLSKFFLASVHGDKVQITTDYVLFYNGSSIKALVQFLHLKGLSPVCINSCRLSIADVGIILIFIRSFYYMYSKQHFICFFIDGEEDRRRDGKITSRNGREWGLEIP